MGWICNCFWSIYITDVHPNLYKSNSNYFFSFEIQIVYCHDTCFMVLVFNCNQNCQNNVMFFYFLIFVFPAPSSTIFNCNIKRKLCNLKLVNLEFLKNRVVSLKQTLPFRITFTWPNQLIFFTWPNFPPLPEISVAPKHFFFLALDNLPSPLVFCG